MLVLHVFSGLAYAFPLPPTGKDFHFLFPSRIFFSLLGPRLLLPSGPGTVEKGNPPSADWCLILLSFRLPFYRLSERVFLFFPAQEPDRTAC